MTHEKNEVTAQQIKSAIVPAYSPYMNGPGVDMDATVKNIEVLISQASREAVEEYKKSAMAEWESYNLHEKVQKARREGRLEGLMEMDGAWDFVTRTSPEDCEMRDPVSVLRQEYQQTN